MNWDAIAAISEGMGSLAVFITLVYLAIQVRQTHRQASASAHLDFMTGWNAQVTGIARDTTTASIVRNGFSDFESLGNEEKMIFQERIAAFANQWIVARELYSRGLLPPALYHGATNVLVGFYSTPGGLAMLEQTAQSIPHAEELLEAARSGRTPSWTDQFPWWAAD